MKQTIHDIATGQITEVELTADEIAAHDAASLELAWHNLRLQRDQLLAACDWTQVADAPVNASAWSVYRQNLRDLPANTTDPTNPVWPTPPA